MGTVWTGEQISITLHTGETMPVSDTDYDYRFFNAVVMGNNNENTYVKINGGEIIKLGGTSVISGPIYTLEVTGADTADGGVLLFGVKSVRTIFN